MRGGAGGRGGGSRLAATVGPADPSHVHRAGCQRCIALHAQFGVATCSSGRYRLCCQRATRARGAGRWAPHPPGVMRKVELTSRRAVGAVVSAPDSDPGQLLRSPRYSAVTVRSEVLTIHGSLAHDDAATVLSGCHALRCACACAAPGSRPPAPTPTLACAARPPPNDGGSRFPAASAAHQKNTAEQRTLGIASGTGALFHRPDSAQ
jgi:hypothetical protein